MKKIMMALAMILLTVSASATLADIQLCPPYVGTFSRGDGGLTVTITRERDKAVAPHTEHVANPPAEKDAGALLSRGAVQFNAHVEKESGRLFVHWETLR